MERRNWRRSCQYTTNGLPPNLTISSSTGVISGTIGNTVDTNSPYTVTVSASDSLVTVSQTFIWSVAHIFVTPPGDQSNVDGDVVALQIQSRHADTATVIYTAQGLPPALRIDPSTGLISGTIDPNANSGSPYTVTVQATEGNYSAGQTFTWTVSPITAPHPGNQTHVAGATVSLPIRGRHYGGTLLHYSATNLPPGLSINTQTGLISGRILPASGWRRYSTAVTIADAAHSSRLAFSWTVTPNGNLPPVVINPGSQINNEDDDIALPIQASDPNGYPLTFSATGLPAGLSIDPNTGWITGHLDDTAFQDTPYIVTVSAYDGTYIASQTFAWLFTAPELMASGVDVSAIEGNTFTGTVATFTNGNVGTGEDATDYAATIDWGDGTALDTGTVTGSGGSYSVLGSHLYQFGSFPITVTISDEGIAFTTVTGTATVEDAGVTATGIPDSVLQGSGNSEPVATFTDLDPYDPNFTATIDWGDSSNSPGTVSGMNGKFIVYGGHGWARHGSYPIGVTIRHRGAVVANTSSTAVAGDFYEGREANLTVSSFRDDDNYETPDDYVATIDWGDMSGQTRGIVTQRSDGSFAISGKHTFTRPGTYTVSVTVNDPGGSSLPARTTVVYVAEQPLTAYTAPVYATTGHAIPNQPIALITDPDPNGTASNARLDWGDNSQSDVHLNESGGLLAVVGDHTYSGLGSYPITASVSLTGGLVLPLDFSGQVAVDPAVKVTPKMELGAKAAGGTFVWDFTAADALGKVADMQYLYIPSKNNKATKIAFIQVILESTLGGNPSYPIPGGAEFFKKFSTKPEKANQLDFIKGQTAPYVNAVWRGGWVDRKQKLREIGNGLQQKNALGWDEPGASDARTGKGDFVIRFEVAAFAIDSQEILGVLTWGMKRVFRF